MTYKTGFIYMIYLKTNPNLRYIGSSLQKRVRDRWQNHKASYKAGTNECSIVKYFDEYGIDEFKFAVIKHYDIFDKKHLLAYEQLHINKLKCINEKDTFGILRKEKDKQYYQRNKEKISGYGRRWRDENLEKCKEYGKNYYKKNSDKIKERANGYRLENLEKCKEYDKTYYEMNRDRIKEKSRTYNETNKEKIRQKKKDYYETNKEKIHKKVICPICSLEMNKSSLTRHNKRKHS